MQLELIFPDKFSNTNILVFNSHYRARLIGILKHIITGETEHKQAVIKEDNYFEKLIQPFNLDWYSPDNAIYEARKGFEKLCVLLIQKGIDCPERMTVMRFFMTINELQKKPK